MIRQQMREAIEQGIQGFLAGCFAGDRQPLDPDTGYPLTSENSETIFNLQHPYEAIEDTFLKYMHWEETEVSLNPTQLQVWVAYFWQYANLIVREKFEPIPFYATPEMEANREGLRAEIIGQGYRRIK